MLSHEAGLQIVENDVKSQQMKPIVLSTTTTTTTTTVIDATRDAATSTAIVSNSNDNNNTDLPPASIVSPDITSSPSVATTSINANASGIYAESNIDILADPEVYRRIEELIAKQFGSICRVEVLQLRVASAAVGSSQTLATKSGTLVLV